MRDFLTPAGKFVWAHAVSAIDEDGVDGVAKGAGPELGSRVGFIGA